MQIKIFDDNSVYIGEMRNGKRNGKGTQYFLNDYFSGYKISGNWLTDKLDGYCYTTTRSYLEQGRYDKGVKNGMFYRDYKDGRHSEVTYKNNVNINEEVVSHDSTRFNQNFGCVKLPQSKFYLGDMLDGYPFGFGIIITVDENNRIIDKQFCEIYELEVVRSISLNSNNIKTEEINQ